MFFIFVLRHFSERWLFGFHSSGISRPARTHAALLSHMINLREVCKSCIIQDGRASRLGKYGWIWSHTITQPLGLLLILLEWWRIHALRRKSGLVSAATAVVDPPVSGLVLRISWFPRVARTPISQTMQHPECLLNIITTMSPAEISERG